MLQKTVTISFYLLFFLTPLIWAPFNFELFEYNKMMFVYLLTIIITTSWILKMIRTKVFEFKRTPLDLPLLLFLLANILSTIFSIDTHTSIWGYYSRSNGGLISTVSYIILYYALVSNFTPADIIKFLKAALLGGFLVSLWAIPEHFGVSPSCVILTGQPTASCWVQNVEDRVFATLGQPNWLSAYLAVLIFPAIYFLLTSKTKAQLITYYLPLITFYLAFTFTYSRGATLGLLAGLAVFLIFLTVPKLKFLKLHFEDIKLNIKPLLMVLIGFLLINLLFGSALTDFKLISKFAAPSRPAIPGVPQKITKVTGTQLENGGTESGQIRLIVWEGALEIVKNYPIFGSGVETFAYSYYNFRPVRHNLVSEWDFLYNKAHNEFLNYLATTGMVGFLSYMGIIITFIFWTMYKIIKSHPPVGEPNSKETFSSHTSYFILHTSLLASYISYLVQNFFGFSVVATALFFFLIPAFTFISTNSTSLLKTPHPLTPFFILLTSRLYKRPFYTKLGNLIIIVISTLFTLTLFRYYLADIAFADGHRANEIGNPGRAYNKLSEAVNLNSGEPYYRSELSYAAAGASVALEEKDASLSAELKDKAVQETEKIFKENPNNVSYFRTAIRTYYLLSSIDKSYTDKTLNVLDKTIALAPTDPKLLYNKALILGQMGRNKEAIEVLQKTVSLRPNYKEAYFSLGLFLFEEKEKTKAIEAIREVLKIIPGDPEAAEKLKEWAEE